MPKENFAIRPALILDPVDRLIYQALVDRIALRLLKDLPDWVYGWRTARTKGTLYADNSDEWPSYVEDVVEIEALNEWALSTDIVSYFPNVEVDRVVEEVGTRGGSTMVTSALELMLQHWDQIAGRGGLPQRSMASAVLANAYLGPVDDVLTVRGRFTRGALKRLLPGGGALRWMDDIWLFGGNELTLRSVQLELQDAMRSLGLEMNFGKTNTHTGETLYDLVQSMHHSGVDAALNQPAKDEQPLEALLEHLLVAPALAPRTSIRFATTRIKEHELYHLTARLITAAPLMPHGADHLGRLFRASDDWHDLGDWWVKYYRSRSGKVDWSVAQLGLMFPAKEAPPVEGILEAVVEQIQSVGSLPMFSFA
ncbi:MAG: RNA-directed DNA polymerase, partial [Acidimicrobiia bacterium]